MRLPPARAWRGRPFALGVVLILSLGLAPRAPAQVLNSKKPEAQKPATEEGMASWYPVPPKSLAKKRAGKDELTAAHNRLPLGTKVRVTHLKNGKNVIVRITDRGNFKRHAIIDLCKEAAEKLDMIREGSARVRLEILPDDKSTKTPAW
jgi:rare lipoprotein A